MNRELTNTHHQILQWLYNGHTIILVTAEHLNLTNLRKDQIYCLIFQKFKTSEQIAWEPIDFLIQMKLVIPSLVLVHGTLARYQILLNSEPS